MTTIGILSEGRTDQIVIEQILLGFFDRADARAFLDELTERNIEIRGE